MDENIKYLYNDCINSCQNIDNILEELSKINGPTLCVGCGGSKVVAEYINLVLSKKNQIICKTLEPRDINYINLELYQNIICASHSGKNYGIKSVLQKPLKKYLLTTRITPIENELTLTYSMERRHSFIAINATIVPMAIMLKYYLGNQFEEIIHFIFQNIDETLQLNVLENVNIFTGIDTLTPAIFLESTLVEAGISWPLIHFKYDYCHGRSTINKSGTYSSIYLENDSTDLDITLKEVLKLKGGENVILKSISEDEVINNFYLTVQSLYLLRNIAIKKKIDLSNVKYDKDVIKKIYYFKGSM